MIIRTRRKSKPPVLRILTDARLFRLLGGCDGTAGVLRTNTDTKEETIQIILARERVTLAGYLPTRAQHGHQAADAVVRTRGCR